MKITKVATRIDIEDLTSNGWTIVTTIANAQVIRTQREIAKDGYNDYRKFGNNDYGQHVYVPAEYKVEMHPCIEPMFIVEKDEELISVEQRLREQIREANSNAAIAEGKVVHLEADLQQAREQFTKINKLADERLEQIVDAQEHARKLEAHLAKVRKEIGEAKWREIIG